MQQIQQIQQMFPQPQGSVYSIDAPIDIGNVPIGSTGLSVAICIQENLMYIKSFQNGSPVLMAYRIEPFTKNEQKEIAPVAATTENDLNERLARIEKTLEALTKKGGNISELL
jgi:hypothetical protein